MRSAAAGLVLGVAWSGVALGAPAVEPRVMTQLGLDVALNFNLLQNETVIIGHFNSSPPACEKLPAGGSVQTLSATMVSKTQYQSQIDIYFDTACTKPYVEAALTVNVSTGSFSISEVASYLGLDGNATGTLSITEHFSVTNHVEILRGLGKFAPVGGQSVADVGFTCNAPTKNNSLTLMCQGGVAQRFPKLALSIASVVPFSITAAKNTASPMVMFTGTASTVQTGPLGSLSITAPTAETLAIGGSGTSYGSTAVSGSESHYAVFPPKPTSWTVTDQGNNAQVAYSILNNTTHAARGIVTNTTTAGKLAVITVDKSGSGKVVYTDKSPAAAIRSYLAAD